MIRLAVAGATGRTGRCVLERAVRDERFEIVAALERPGSAVAGSMVRVGERRVSVGGTLEAPCEVLIDFTVPDGTMAWLEVCRPRGIAMVVGVTGHNRQQLDRIADAAKSIPVLKATNFSVGIQAIMAVVSALAAKLGDGYDIEIIEAHHRHKVDAPSGTALTLAEELAVARGFSRSKCVTFGREGLVGERPSSQIGIHAVRMGEVVGWHEIHFSGPGETVTIRHSAHSRDTFAAGALRAAAWIVNKPPGSYSMRDVIG